MKKIVFGAFILLALAACKKDKTHKVDSPTEVSQIPYGEEGELESGNYTGEGTVTNVAGTTVSIEEDVTIDALSISGKVIVPTGATLTVIGELNVGGGASIEVKGTLICGTYTQVGNSFVKNGKLDVNGKYTIGGGTTLYLENSEVECNELVIIGHIQAVENESTSQGNYYSMIELTGNKYLNRGGGTTVCGPVLFTLNTDQGASGVQMDDITNTALTNNAALRTTYGLGDNVLLYQYQESCTPLSKMPN